MQLPFVVVKCEKIVSVLFEQGAAKKNIFRCAKLNSENKFRSLRRATKGCAQVEFYMLDFAEVQHQGGVRNTRKQKDIHTPPCLSEKGGRKLSQCGCEVVLYLQKISESSCNYAQHVIK